MSGSVITSCGKALTPALYLASGNGASYAAASASVRLGALRLSSPPTGKSGWVATYSRQASKPGPGEVPTARPVFIASSRDSRGANPASIGSVSPSSPPQSWTTSGMPDRSRRSTSRSRKSRWNSKL